MAPADSNILLDALVAHVQLLTMAVSGLAPEAFLRLIGVPFRIRVTLAGTPRADYVVVGESTPVCTVMAADWPPLFGTTIAEFANQTLRHQSDDVRRQVAGLQARGAVLTVEADPDLWTFDLLLRVGDRRVSLGRLAPEAPAPC